MGRERGDRTIITVLNTTRGNTGMYFGNRIEATCIPTPAEKHYPNSPVSPIFDHAATKRGDPCNVLPACGSGQGAYRKSIINRWENKCAVTGFRDSRVLIASHIHPWKEATHEERLDVNNGILLSPTYDALFDRHLITFENSGGIVLSNSIDYDEYRKLGVSGRERICRLNSDNVYYLARHQEVFEERERGR